MGFFDNRQDRGDLGPPPDPFRIGGDTPFRSPIALRWIGVAAAALVLFIVLNVGKSLYVDWLWFDSIGPGGDISYGSVFRTVLVAQVSLFFIGALLSGAVLGLNIWLARRFAPVGDEESFIEEIDPQAIRRIVSVALVAGTLFMAVVFGSVASGAWETILMWLNAVSFGQTDPAFNRDISFYLFDLPALHFFQGWALAVLVVAVIGSGFVYGLTLSLQRFELNITPPMRVHLSVLVGLILLVIAFGTWLSIFDLATSAGGIVAGATYTDVNARVPVRWLLTGLAALAGALTIANAFVSTGYRLPAFALGLWAFAGILGGVIYPSFVQSIQVEPNERQREEPFIQDNIRLTRLAYGISEIEETSFPALPQVTAAEIEANPATIDNIRLLDARPLKDTLNANQALRPFHVFNDVDVDRYTIDGVSRQFMLSARELDVRRAEGANWTRERLQLTHGYGAVVAPVNEVNEQGLPNLLTRDMPPVGDVIPISENGARIYFGELTNQHVIVKTNEPEFDFPLGEGQQTTSFGPDRGIRISSPWRRLALAWDLGDWNLMISSQIGSGSRLLMDRSLTQRIRKLAPFLTLDSDPYLVATPEGDLFWIQDAYTTSTDFPYSQPRPLTAGSINYIRNSMKITVDTVTGDTIFYLVDPDDPIAATWNKIFPDLFTPADEMPELVVAHLRYPEDLFKVQSDLYLRYHVKDASVFFTGEDFWAVPTEKFRQQEQLLEPYYVIMTLPGEEQAEFALILPFTPIGKQNTIAWLAGRSDGANLGTLRAYRFPTESFVNGPALIEAQIDQDTGISQQLTLWDQAGSEVIRGNLLMIPIGESFLFVEPIYLQASTSRFPELKKVVVANGSSIAMETTFEHALDVLFGRRASSLPGSGIIAQPPSTQPDATPPPPPGTGTTPSGDLQQLLGDARSAADGAQAEIDRLRRILDAIEQQQR